MNPLKPLRLAVAALRDEVNKQEPDKGAIWSRIQEVLKEADKLDVASMMEPTGGRHDALHAPPRPAAFEEF